MSDKKILMVVAPEDFRDEELLVPKKIFENAGAKVTVASKGVRQAKGMLGAKVSVDKDLAEVQAEDFDAVVFVGGGGAQVYFADPVALSLAKASYESGKVTAAICIAPTILANAGVLAGKKATVWSSYGGKLKEKGADYTGKEVSVDGRIITANGPDAAQEFAEKIIETLGG